MDPLEEQLTQLNLLNSRSLSPCTKSSQYQNRPIAPTTGKVAALISNLQESAKCKTDSVTVDVSGVKLNPCAASAISPKKVGPIVPPKPHKKKQNTPEVPQSRLVKPVCEPLYSQRLQSLDSNCGRGLKLPGREAILQRKQPVYSGQHSLFDKTSKVTLDNPAILEQQLEALAHHKKQLEKKGLLQQQQQHNSHHKISEEGRKTLSTNMSCIPKLSSTSLINQEALRSHDYGGVIYSNFRPLSKQNNGAEIDVRSACENIVYKNIGADNINQYNKGASINGDRNNIYANLIFEKNNFDDLPPPPPGVLSIGPVDDTIEYINNSDEVPPPPSPVSSSYSELRRATDAFSKKSCIQNSDDLSAKGACYPAVMHCDQNSGIDGKLNTNAPTQSYMNMNYSHDYNSYSSTLPSSSTYESIYEPINPRSPSQLSTRSNYQLYAPYVNDSQLKESSGGVLSHSSSVNISSIGTSGANTPHYPTASSGSATAGNTHNPKYTVNKQQKEAEVEALTDFLVHSLDTGSDVDNYGICFKCNERVLGENSGCTAMDQIYHIACFTCSQCQINLQGKPFYALDGKPFCEYDYLQTLEKCSVCMKPILERILRATGKPYHPQCFTCVVCGNSLDGIPFTVDATNQNYCIADFHKKFAPRCCVCKEPIMPEPGEEETVRVVALDRSFHFECYKCEDCGLLLSSEAEGRGCYPLDDHVLCKSCNAKRVQMLTSRMTTEL